MEESAHPYIVPIHTTIHREQNAILLLLLAAIKYFCGLEVMEYMRHLLPYRAIR
jgi:hypothetical protein